MFDANIYYRTRDKALLQIASFSTLDRWRSQGLGPSYIKLGCRVLYSGRALNEWIEDRTVRPAHEHKAMTG